MDFRQLFPFLYVAIEQAFVDDHNFLLFFSIIVSVPNQFHLFCTVLGIRYCKLNIRSILHCHLFTQVKHKAMIPGTWADCSF